MSGIKSIFGGFNLVTKHLFINQLKYIKGRAANRYLFSNAAIGLDTYAKTRDRIKMQFMDMEENYKTKVVSYIDKGSDQMIFTEDLKNMLHLIGDTDEELNMIAKMIKKFNKQNKELRFGNFIFGPVVMRTFFHLNQPKIALEMFQDPELEGFFDQLISFQLLLELLLRNEQYQEMLEVYEIIKTKQIQGLKFPKNSMILVLAACYKLNSAESLKYSIDLWNQMLQAGNLPTRRATTLAAALALNQNAPHIALEILGQAKQQNYVTIRNLKIVGLADIGRPEDAFPILRHFIETDVPGQRQSTFCSECIDRVKVAIDKLGNKEFCHTFDRLEKQLTELNMIKNNPVDDLLMSEIEAFQEQDNRFNQGIRRNVNFYERSRPFQQRSSLRPGLHQLE